MSLFYFIEGPSYLLPLLLISSPSKGGGGDRRGKILPLQRRGRR